MMVEPLVLRNRLCKKPFLCSYQLCANDREIYNEEKRTVRLADGTAEITQSFFPCLLRKPGLLSKAVKHTCQCGGGLEPGAFT